MDKALGSVNQAQLDQDSRLLNSLLFEALTKVRAEQQLVEAQLEAAKEQFPEKQEGGAK